jgi:ubiquinone/menaquinone biosynthesis C-methylase UbiE
VLNQSPDFPEFDDRTAAIWDSIAEWWDDRIGDGNATQDLLVEPSQERLLELRPGERVLDIGCGAGRFTRRMATNDVSIIAIDQANVFLDIARRRTAAASQDVADRIDYRLVNATDNEAMLALGEGRFDAAVATMAIMDMASITPMISALAKLLKPGGRFVWSITHPAFNSGTARLFAEEEYRDGELVQHYGVRVTDYLSVYEIEGLGIPGQPSPQYYFHRPVSLLFNACFEAGFMLDSMEEPAIPPGNENSGTNPLSWARIHDVPQVLVARMRLPG